MAIDNEYPNEKETTKFVTIEYVEKTSEDMSNLLSRNSNCMKAFGTSNTVKALLEIIQKNRPSGVYILNCGDCPMVYVVQTERLFKERIKEHEKFITKSSIHSASADLLRDSEYNFNQNFDILHE